jgi:hypothetical protein
VWLEASTGNWKSPKSKAYKVTLPAQEKQQFTPAGKVPMLLGGKIYHKQSYRGEQYTRLSYSSKGQKETTTIEQESLKTCSIKIIMPASVLFFY